MKKNKLYVLETIMDTETEMFILRNGKGEYEFATSDSDELIEYLRDPRPERFDPVEQ